MTMWLPPCLATSLWRLNKLQLVRQGQRIRNRNILCTRRTLSSSASTALNGSGHSWFLPRSCHNVPRNGPAVNQNQFQRSIHRSPTTIDSEQLWDAMTPQTQTLAATILAHHKSGGFDANSSSTATATASNSTSSSTTVHPRMALSRAITLMESKHPEKKQQGDHLLTYLLSQTTSSSPSSSHKKNENESLLSSYAPATGSSLRIGFAGPPGAGKSSLMEAFGMYLLEQDPDLRLAVVCIDPSSGISGGSILGDKTRMTELSRHDRAVVRPSSNKGVLGGLAAYTDDVVRLLASAGYPLVLVETVGLGQSEIEVAESVDVLVLLLSPSGGDELQGVKKGIVEIANILAVTKADGELEAAANRTATDYSGALQVLRQSNSSGSGRSRKSPLSHSLPSDDNEDHCQPPASWVPPVVLTSSVNQRGLDDLWKEIIRYKDYLIETGRFEDRRQQQAKYWMWKQFTRMMQVRMQDDPELAARAERLEEQMLMGLLTPRVAAQELLDGVFQAASSDSKK